MGCLRGAKPLFFLKGRWAGIDKTGAAGRTKPNPQALRVCYNNRQMNLKNFIKITAFVLIIAGTAGLLLNEFVWEHSTTRTIIFAVVTFVGLVNLAFARFGMGQK